MRVPVYSVVKPLFRPFNMTRNHNDYWTDEKNELPDSSVTFPLSDKLVIELDLQPKAEPYSAPQCNAYFNTDQRHYRYISKHV